MKKNLGAAAFFLASCLFFIAFSKVFPSDFSSQASNSSSQNQKTQTESQKTKNFVSNKSQSENDSDSRKTISGNALSKYIEKSLAARSFQASTQRLAPTGQDNFAENIYLDFFSESKNGNPQNQESLRSTAVLDFTQEDFYQNEDEFLSFLSDVKNFHLDYDLTVLFSALTTPAIPEKSNSFESRLSGTEIFAENLPAPDESFAVSVSFDKSRPDTILTGALHSTSPLWLCRKISETFYAAGKNYSFPNLISSLYRLGFINGDARMNDFVKSEIPAISVSFENAKDGLNLIKNFLLSYDSAGSDEWEQHYVFMPLHYPLKPVVLNEFSCIGIFVILAVLTLLSLCVISFTGKQGEQNKYDLLKNLYMIPLSLAVSFLGLSLAQFFLKSFSSSAFLNPVVIFGTKIIAAMFFVSAFYALHNILKLPTDIFIYSYIIQFIALFNIFYFSMRDILLFVPFGVEYILIFIFRKQKSLASLIVFLSMMVLPFVPYAVDILQKTSEEDFPSLLFTNFAGNFSVSLALFPFQIIWLKILVRLEIFNKSKKYSVLKLVRNGIVSTASILAFCFFVMQAIYLAFYKDVRENSEKSKIFIKDSDSKFCRVSLSHDEFSGLSTNHIKISSEKDALRYSVKIKSLDYKIPIYDSIYAYDFSSEKTENGKTAEEVTFVVPDYPPEKITIDYAASPDSYAEIEVSAFYKGKGEKEILREKTSVFTKTNQKENVSLQKNKAQTRTEN